MYYIYWEYSIAGWVFAGVFFVFLAGFLWRGRCGRQAIKDSDEKQS